VSPRDSASTTGIRSKLGPISDEAFENDAGGALGDPNLTPAQREQFDKKTAELKAQALRIRAAKGRD